MIWTRAPSAVFSKYSGRTRPYHTLHERRVTNAEGCESLPETLHRTCRLSPLPGGQFGKTNIDFFGYCPTVITAPSESVRTTQWHACRRSCSTRVGLDRDCVFVTGNQNAPMLGASDGGNDDGTTLYLNALQDRIVTLGDKLLFRWREAAHIAVMPPVRRAASFIWS